MSMFSKEWPSKMALKETEAGADALAGLPLPTGKGTTFRSLADILQTLSVILNLKPKKE